MADSSRLWAEFRLAVVGHLVVGDLDRGQLGAELKSLSAKKWKHPITGTRVTFGYSTIIQAIQQGRTLRANTTQVAKSSQCS